MLLLFFVVTTLWQASQTLQATQAGAKSLAELAAESNAAAVRFEDRQGAQKQLEIFRHIQSVETVDIYTDSAGAQAFAHYPMRNDATPDPVPPAALVSGQQTSSLSLSRYAIRLPIVHDGEHIGVVVVQTRLHAFWWSIAVTLLVAVVAMLLAYAVVRQFMGQLIDLFLERPGLAAHGLGAGLLDRGQLGARFFAHPALDAAQRCAGVFGREPRHPHGRCADRHRRGQPP